MRHTTLLTINNCNCFTSPSQIKKSMYLLRGLETLIVEVTDEG